MSKDQMFRLAHGLALAKSRQDVPAALRFMHATMWLESPFGTPAHGTEENEKALRRFFASFPDYQVRLDGHASDGETLVCWGCASMTMTGKRFGVKPNGRRAELAVFITFTFRDDLIASERFFFDLSVLCAQSGTSTDAVRRKLFGESIAIQAAEEP